MDFLRCQILNPGTFSDHPIAQGAFDEIGTLADKIQGDDGDGGITAEAEGDGGDDAPDEAAIEDEGNGRFAAGAEGKVGGSGVGIEGHDARGNEDQHCRDMTNGVAGDIKPGEEAGNRRHGQAKGKTAANGNQNQFVVGIPDFRFGIAGTQHLAHDNAYGGTHGQEGDAGQIKQGIGDVESRDHIQTAGRIALSQEGYTAGPEKLIGQKGQALEGDGAEQLTGNPEGAVDTLNKRHLFFIPMGPAGHDGKLHKAGNGGRPGGAATPMAGAPNLPKIRI